MRRRDHERIFSIAGFETIDRREEEDLKASCIGQTNKLPGQIFVL
jgi:hypothetical protein